MASSYSRTVRAGVEVPRPKALAVPVAPPTPTERLAPAPKLRGLAPPALPGLLRLALRGAWWRLLVECAAAGTVRSWPTEPPAGLTGVRGREKEPLRDRPVMDTAVVRR